MILRCLIGLLVTSVFLGTSISQAFAVEAMASEPAANNPAVAALAPGRQHYVIPMQGCAIEFVAKMGGRAEVGGGSTRYPYGYFVHSQYFPNSEIYMSFSLSCRPGSAAELCPKLMADSRETDLVMIRDTQMRDLSYLNPRYYTDAYIATATAVPTPRRRDLTLCMGDDTRTLVTENGGFPLGYDPREIWQTHGRPVLRSSELALPEVLEIIRSIRFLPDHGK